MTTETQPLPTDAELLAEWDRVSHIADAGQRRLACLRAVLANLGTPPAVAGEPEGWITWWPTAPGVHKPVYSHGPNKPSHGPALDSRLRKYPVFTPQPTQAQAGAVPLTDEWIRSMCKEPWIFDNAKQWVHIVEAAHGIKGDQHGTE